MLVVSRYVEYLLVRLPYMAACRSVNQHQHEEFSTAGALHHKHPGQLFHNYSDDCILAEIVRVCCEVKIEKMFCFGCSSRFCETSCNSHRDFARHAEILIETS